jgi:hypothetical protein
VPPPGVAVLDPGADPGPVLAPHRAWQAHLVPDAHGALQWAIIEGIVDIVTGEGPVVTDRVYELYVRASGGRRVTKPVRDALDQATAAALRRGLLDKTQDRVTGRSVRTLYLPGTPPVVLRRRGDRELEHIPPTEVAAVARHILDRDTGINNSELKRLLLIATWRAPTATRSTSRASSAAMSSAAARCPASGSTISGTVTRRSC